MAEVSGAGILLGSATGEVKSARWGQMAPDAVRSLGQKRDCNLFEVILSGGYEDGHYGVMAFLFSAKESLAPSVKDGVRLTRFPRLANHGTRLNSKLCLNNRSSRLQKEQRTSLLLGGDGLCKNFAVSPLATAASIKPYKATTFK